MRRTECEAASYSGSRTSILRSHPYATKIAGFLADFVELGVRGFRIDAAKHILPEDFAGDHESGQRSHGA